MSSTSHNVSRGTTPIGLCHLPGPRRPLSIDTGDLPRRPEPALWMDGAAACEALGVSRPTLSRLFTAYPELRLSIEKRARKRATLHDPAVGYLYSRIDIERLARIIEVCELRPIEAVRVMISYDQGRV